MVVSFKIKTNNLGTYLTKPLIITINTRSMWKVGKILKEMLNKVPKVPEVLQALPKNITKTTSISSIASLPEEFYMKRYMGDLGTLTKNKPVTPGIAAAKEWSANVKKILDNKKMSSPEKLISFYALNDSQMRNDDLDHTMVPGKVVGAFSDSEFDLYVVNNKEAIDNLIKELKQNFAQYDLFTKNQTAFIKGIDLVIDKVATRMPIVGSEVRVGYFALKKLAIEL